MKNIIKIFLLLAILVSCRPSNESEIVIKYRKEAEKDITSDSVKNFSRTFIKLSKKEIEMQQKMVEIQRKYGLHQKSVKTVVSYELKEAEAEYQRIVFPYLEKRNGKGWREKMSKEIDSMLKNYR